MDLVAQPPRVASLGLISAITMRVPAHAGATAGHQSGLVLEACPRAFFIDVCLQESWKWLRHATGAGYARFELSISLTMGDVRWERTRAAQPAGKARKYPIDGLVAAHPGAARRGQAEMLCFWYTQVTQSNE